MDTPNVDAARARAEKVLDDVIAWCDIDPSAPGELKMTFRSKVLDDLTSAMDGETDGYCIVRRLRARGWFGGDARLVAILDAGGTP